MNNKSKDLNELLITNLESIQKENTGEYLLNLADLPYLADHAFQGMIVLPGSAYIEMALIVYHRLFHNIPGAVKDIEFQSIILLSEEETVIEFEVNRLYDNTVKLKFSEKNVGGKNTAGSTTSTSMLLLDRIEETDPVLKNFNIASFVAQSAFNIKAEKFYSQLYENGNQYGPEFQHISEIWISDNVALGKLNSSSKGSDFKKGQFIRPSLLDSFTQLLSSLSDARGRTFVLNLIDEIKIYDLNLPEDIWCKATLLSEENETGFNGDLEVIDSTGKIFLILKSINFRYLEQHDLSVPEPEHIPDICIVSTFTADPIEDSLRYWSRQMQSPYQFVFAPYNQVFQELLDSKSSFHKNKNGINVILLGLEDWAGDDNYLLPKVDTEKVEELFGNKERYMLPNQIPIVHLNKYETEYVYKEIFEDRVYLKHGIVINDGDTVIDIGANIGLFTLFINQHCRNTTIYSFEPSPLVYQLLKANSMVYGENVKTFNLGVSDKSKTARFTFYKSSSVFSSFNADEKEDSDAIQAVVRNMLGDISSSETGDLIEYVEEITSGRLESQTYNCRLISVSDIIKENSIEKIDLLKIDAEKSELEIIKGIDNSDWDKIKQIVIEVHDKKGDIFKEIKSILSQRGFYFKVEEEKFLKESGLYNIYATRNGEKSITDSLNRSFVNKRNKLNENLDNFIHSLNTFMGKSETPMVVAFCKRSPAVLSEIDLRTMYDEMENELSMKIGAIPNVYLLRSGSIEEKYPVRDYYDPHGNELGHIPYSNEYFTSLGTMIFRNIFSIQKSSFKVIVLDCDNTLWKGICGEDGVSGIQITGGYLELQRFILAQMKSGMIVCLCSKNNEEDVFEVFDKRDDMILKREHIVSWKINWNRKSENLKALAKELNLGLDTFIFLDDNPVECGEVKINCPEVLTLQIPEDERKIKNFLNNVWAFDHLKLTEEDKKRTRMYKENIEREKYRESSVSLKDFLEGLHLNIKISAPSPGQISRISQLTYRTNQFNFTTIRRTESEVNAFLSQGQNRCLTAVVSDRFGDYGLVGVLFYSFRKKNLIVDTFLLSCRVLGRGVEYKILSELGKIAREESLENVEIKYSASPKNRPALEFIEKIGPDFKTEIPDGSLFLFPVEYLANLTYDTFSSDSDESGSRKKESKNYKKKPEKYLDLSTQIQHIADNLNMPDVIHRNVDDLRLSTSDIESRDFVPPDTDIEKQISLIWQKVLGKSKIGLNDNFFEIGGSSLKAVQLIALMKKELGIKLSVVKLFECPTVGLMSKNLFNSAKENEEDSSEDVINRGKRRRENLRIRRGRT